jgi:hypothetical protein
MQSIFRASLRPLFLLLRKRTSPRATDPALIPPKAIPEDVNKNTRLIPPSRINAIGRRFFLSILAVIVKSSFCALFVRMGNNKMGKKLYTQALQNASTLDYRG